MKNKILIYLVLAGLSGCSSVNLSQIKQENLKPEANFEMFEFEKSSKDVQANNTYVVNAGNESGASFLAQINIKSSDFSVKSSNGTNAKKVSDITKLDIYLLQLSSAPASGSDPLALVNIIASKTDIQKTQSSSFFSILFQNIPPNTSSNQYFVGVVLKDVSNNGLAKFPSILWTGNTANIAPTLTVSSSGITVFSNMTVSTTADLNLSVTLQDVIGATADGGVYINDGNKALPAITAN